jgi:hypothetical protein
MSSTTWNAKPRRQHEKRRGLAPNRAEIPLASDGLPGVVPAELAVGIEDLPVGHRAKRFSEQPHHL